MTKTHKSADGESQGHSHDHDHDPGGHAGHEDHRHSGHAHSHGENASRKRLWAAFVLLITFTVVEAIGGLWANSIALLSEAAHMFADSAALLLAIGAISMGQRAASPDRTYGHRRYQTLAAYTNGLSLLALTVWVVVEAARRLLAPPPVDGRLMLGVAIVGGIANFAAFLVLSGAKSLNERGARAHVLGDLLGSGAATAAALIVMLSGWLPADPLLSIFMSALILRSGWSLTRDSAHVLLEGTPSNLSIEKVEAGLKTLPGVAGIHHVHAWSLTGESPIVTLHAQLTEHADRQQTLAAIIARLRERFGVEHATVQIEEGGCVAPPGSDTCHGPTLQPARRQKSHRH